MASRINGGIGGVWMMLGLAVAGMFCATPVHAQQYKGSYETTAEVPLREGPGNYHKIITLLPKGIQINVVGKEGFWLRVESKHGGKPGYIDEQFARAAVAAPTQSTPSTPTAPTAVAGWYRTLREQGLRETPSTTARVVTRLPADIKVNVIRETRAIEFAK